jgi:sugar O-acyltransferase (sialic acid O-acetyltransferase NeuD family)
MPERADKIIIIGDGEFARIAYEYFTFDSPHEIIAFSVEKEFLHNTELFGLPVVPFESLEDHYAPAEYKIFVAITFTQLNRIRTRLYHSARQKGYRFVSYISSKAFVANSARIGENCFIYEHCSIQPFVRIENNVICGSGSRLSHSCTVLDNVFLAAAVVIGGYSKLGENCFIGLNSTIIDQIELANDCVIGAGSVVLQDVKTPSIHRGNPARDTGIDSLLFFKMKGGRL